MTNKIIKNVIIVILIIILLLGAGSFIYKFIKNQQQKQVILNKVEEVKNDLKNIENNLSKENDYILDKYNTDNDNITKELNTNDFFLFDEYSYSNSTNNLIIIEIDDKKYAKEFPTNYEDMSNTIVLLQKTVNTINKARKEDHIRYLNTITNTIEYVKVVQTNVVVLKEEVEKFVKPKLFSYGVGLTLAFEGTSQNKDIFYRVAGHGTLYILDSWYVGLELGVAYNLSFNPVVGIMVGVKF